MAMKLTILLHFYSRKRMHFLADWMPISWNNFVHYFFLSFLRSISLCGGANQKNYSLIDADSFSCCVFYEFQGCSMLFFSCNRAAKMGSIECTLCALFFVINLGKCIGKCANYQTMTQIMRLWRLESREESKY